MAQEKVMNHLLSCYSCGREIRQHELMDYLSIVVKRLNNELIQQLVETEKQKLASILPEITAEMISSKNTILSSAAIEKAEEIIKI